MSTYYGVIHKDPDSDYGIHFPDLPGCYSAGSTLDELDVMAKEAISLHLEGLQEDGDPIPAPSTDYKQLYKEHCEEEGFYGLTLVTVPEKVKRVRVNISLPEQDLQYIDTVADKYGLDRSGFLLFAAKKVGSGACGL